MKLLQHFFVAFLSGLLLFAAWPISPFTILIFVAFIPLLWLEANTSNTARFFWLAALNMFVWNISTTWWIWNASPGGAVGAILLNTLLMCLPIMLFRFAKKKLGVAIGYAAFVLFWISWEYFHHNWDLSWPWLTVGNVFGTSTMFVQWYQFTGTTGGSLWVLLINVLLYHLLFCGEKKLRINLLLALNLLFLLPVFISLIIFYKKEPQAGALSNVVVVQPNVHVDPENPYNDEKFTTPPGILIDKMVALSESRIDASTQLVVWPETAIPIDTWEDEIKNNTEYKKIFDFTKRHPKIMLITGIDSYKNWGTKNPGGFSIRTLQNGNHYEAFNTALATNSSADIQLYHKSKLVPGPESLPSWLGFLGTTFTNLGGSNGTLGKSDSAIVFTQIGNTYKPAPIICYESIYSNYVTEYVRKGANVLAVITNDGWWKNTPGYRQHESMSRLRAVENNRWVVRSANTGISCFIDTKGNEYNAQPWDTATAIKMDIPTISRTTFYTRHGDWISRFSWPIAALLLFSALFTGFKQRK